MLLGCIADDFTGATDLANTLTRRGMRTVQTIGVPPGGSIDADAIVIALKSRTILASEAVAQSLSACRWLRSSGAKQIFFKYCSTFDSTDAGNIGPVADALLDEIGASFTIACPAFPENGRTVYQGHLFVGTDLLSDSAMRNHPLTPMRDSSLVRVLGRQSRHKVGLVPLATVRSGPKAMTVAFDTLAASGHRHAIVDAVDDTDLDRLGEACAGLAVITGGSGAAAGLPRNYVSQGLLAARNEIEPLAPAGGSAAVLSGSCSPATLAQVARMKASHPFQEIEPLALAREPETSVAVLLDWARDHLPEGPVLISASAPPERVAAVQAELGREKAGELVEQAMAALARGLVAAGVRRLVIAGGETSGSVVGSLGVTALRIGPQIDPGVPATLSIGDPPLALALKSGNFGSPEFFLKALTALQ